MDTGIQVRAWIRHAPPSRACCPHKAVRPPSIVRVFTSSQSGTRPSSSRQSLLASQGRQAAVHHEAGAGDVAGIAGRQERDRRCHLIHSAHPAHYTFASGSGHLRKHALNHAASHSYMRLPTPLSLCTPCGDAMVATFVSSISASGYPIYSHADVAPKGVVESADTRMQASAAFMQQASIQEAF